jgi:two-component system nitrogen regulation response regulator GlnG
VLSEVLELVDGNRLVASRWLGLARATVRKMIARHLPGVASSDDENGKTSDENPDDVNPPRSS